ncbi:MAG: GH43_30 / GH43 / GH43_3 / GH43_8 / GH43_ 31 / GH43_33 / GH43_5 / GH43_34 / GH43_4 / GH43_32 / GH117 / GH43_26 / GH43_17 / GH43_9 / GH43_10 [uncultured Frankineae bacterium]|uniref:GH43_30 / GH43 / GH43_3 / GH43_8 / GH43_ 31 / GH43_33 / GH43_5 / GH43_34 / GH43_4 / GH43_32 / GH117 / GH43_26 / GH43_17 / GH43_9 / GH43_10 n=1 Tax=uncultured Frankineae bacterium TaxID=437475 RepID=A0A6J4KGF9_9ACTN|nr:MAG: GH43_30 / GH43 / GH43_3 / GH43_8 / GH43_ 31 / GH43_33 / GH43_5 / GH43_34 / GH43_4 / GH43_32 / GH117 / GH43_26 / GH43_17 / GH43_9 / GH43_10 [uncultured Frankineae bacterium]
MRTSQRRGGLPAAALACVLALTACGAADEQGSSAASGSGSSTEFTNPVLDTDFADPHVVRDGDTFYAYATGLPDDFIDIQVSTSDDLVEWSEPEDALGERPDWQPLEAGLTWAPEVVEVGGRWLMYYVARETASGKQCLALAVASDPAGPFEDTSTEPMLCQRDLGGSIDAFVFTDTASRRWMFWKNDGNAVGLDTRIWVAPLSADGTRVQGTPVDTGLRQTRPWQGALVEAPTVVLHEGTYVLFYSANDYASDTYAMGYATATAVTGPYTDRSQQPWVDSEGEATGPGGQAVLEVDGQQWLVYHAWEAGEEGYDGDGRRAMWLDRLTWQPGRPPGQAVPVLEGPTDDPQPRPVTTD